MKKNILNGTFNTSMIRKVTNTNEYIAYRSEMYKNKIQLIKPPRRELLTQRELSILDNNIRDKNRSDKSGKINEDVEVFEDLGSFLSVENDGDNLDNDSSTEQKNCEACQAPATKYVNFGATACDSCRAFFRRAIRTSHYRDFVCQKKGNCKISPSTRKGCQKCRLEKCFNIGMKKSLVLSKDQRLKRFKNLRTKTVSESKEKSQQLPLNSDIRNEGSEEDADMDIELSRKQPYPDTHYFRQRAHLPLQENDKTEVELDLVDSGINSSASSSSLQETVSYRGTLDSRKRPDESSRTFGLGSIFSEIFVLSGEDYINIVNELVSLHDQHYRAINFGEDIIKSMIMSSIYGMPMSEKDCTSSYKLTIQRVVRVAKHFTEFTDLPNEVQELLLKHNADLIVSLREAVFFQMDNGIDQILNSCGKEDVKVAKNLIMSTLNSKNVKESDYKMIPYEKNNNSQKVTDKSNDAMEGKYHHFLTRIGAAVSFNPNLVKLLSYLILFCTVSEDNEIDIIGTSLIKKAQDHLIHITQKYVFSTYPGTMASSVFEEMMKCIGLLKKLCSLQNQRETIKKLDPIRIPIVINSITNNSSVVINLE